MFLNTKWNRNMLKKEINLAEVEDLQLWNDENSAFIKKDIYEGKPMWLIYDSAGERIAATDNRDFAFIVARQNDLVPYSVH